MASIPRVTATIPGHGVFVASTAVLDIVIDRHLPASVNDLRARVSAVAEGIDYSDVHEVSAFLMILADWEQGRIDNDHDARALVALARALPSAEV